MSLQQSRAVRGLFRTCLKLTNDVEKALLRSSSQKTSLAAWMDRVDSTISRGKTAITPLQTVSDLRTHVQESFRQQLGEDEEGSNLKEQIAMGIQGIRQLEGLLHLVQTDMVKPVGTMPTKKEAEPVEIDDTWVDPYINQVEWLPSFLEDAVESPREQEPPLTTDTTAQLVEFPLFPLAGPCFVPDQPLELFAAHSYSEVATPGSHVQLQIFEPRYRELYSDLLTEPPPTESSGQSRRLLVVVPFAHPYEPATYATHGLAFEITDWKEVADETNGVLQYVCDHVVHCRPVRIHRVVNPHAWMTKETYVRVEGCVVEQEEAVALDDAALARIGEALDKRATMPAGTATATSWLANCRLALRTEGVWGFLQRWNSSLQQRLLQIELQLAAQVKLVLKSEGAPSHARVQALVAHVQNPRRAEVLRLKLDLALSIPRLLQSKTAEERLQVLLGLLADQRQ
jgi:hypothetical protein